MTKYTLPYMTTYIDVAFVWKGDLFTRIYRQRHSNPIVSQFILADGFGDMLKDAKRLCIDMILKAKHNGASADDIMSACKYLSDIVKETECKIHPDCD